MEKQDILTSSKVVSYAEIFTYYLNMFKDKLTAAAIDKAHYERLKIMEPGYSIMQNGKTLTVDDLIETQKKTMMFASKNIAYIEESLEKTKDGNEKMLTLDLSEQSNN